MSILADLLSQFGGLSGMAKQGGMLQQMGGASPQNFQNAISQINPAFMSAGQAAQAGQYGQPQGQQTQPPQQDGSWIDRNSGVLAELGGKLGAWGAGVSKASDFSRTPIGFGTALAGGTEAVDAYDKAQLDTRLKESEIVKDGQMDLEKTAQSALVKLNMGGVLTPQEQAALQAYDTMQQSKLTYAQDKFGQFIPHPANRSVLPEGFQGGQGMPAQVAPGQQQQQGQQLRPQITPQQAAAELQRRRSMGMQ